MSDSDHSRAILETDTDPETMSILLRSRRQLVKTVVVGLWLIGWALGEASAIVGLFLVPDGFTFGFLLVWLAIWTTGGVKVLTAFLWLAAGYERMTLSPRTITVTRGIPLRRRRTTCDATAVTDLRAIRIDPDHTEKHDGSNGLNATRDAGTIKFNYGDDTLGFGLGLDHRQARDLADLMLRRFPQFGPVNAPAVAFGALGNSATPNPAAP